MATPKQAALIGLIAATLGGCADDPAESRVRHPTAPATMAVATAPSCPAGWRNVPQDRNTPGVVLCARVSQWTRQTEYVQLISLERGARLFHLYDGPIATPTIPSPEYRKHTLDNWWVQNQLLVGKLCMTNGAYFKTPLNVVKTTPMSFPLKSSGTIVTAGFETVPKAKLLAFMWDNSTAKVVDYTGGVRDIGRAARALPYRNAVIGYPWNFNGGAAIARTYIGIQARVRGGTSSTIAIYSTPKALAWQAQEAMNAMNVLDVVQLDGGDSAELRCRDIQMQSGGRTVPHVLMTVAAAR